MITKEFKAFEGATAQTHSKGVEIINTPSEVSTDHPSMPPTRTKAPNTDMDTADIPGNNINSISFFFSITRKK